MTDIYLIRHAEAEGNIYRRAHGHHNGLVTLKGRKQIELLRERFSGERIDAVYSSDLARAMATAAALSQPRNLEIKTTHMLREVDLGIWEDRTWGDIGHNDYEMNTLFNNDPANWYVKGCERYDSVGKRMHRFISKAAVRHDGGTIAVFSHGFAIRTFMCLIMDIRSEEFGKMPYCDNTAVTLLHYDGGRFTVGYAGDNTHLGESDSTLAGQSWWRAGEKQKPENLRFFPLSEVASENLLRIFKAKAGKRALVDTQYAAYLDDVPVGIIGLDTQREANLKAGWLSYIHVVPEHRSCTFGTQLIGLAVSDFRKLRRERLRMELPSGSPGINFMSKCGFSVMVTTETSCRMEKEIRNW